MKKNSYPKTVCFYFQVHQPYRVRRYSFFEDESKQDYFVGPEQFENQKIFEKVAIKSYLPMTDLLLKNLQTHPEYRVSFSLSGVFLEQCEAYGIIGQQVLNNFKALAKTGQVEFLAETYYHSLAFLYSKQEFLRQVALHSEKIFEHFQQKPRVFRNTELIYSDELASFIQELGFEAIIAEGWDHVLGGHHPNHVKKNKIIDLHPEDYVLLENFKNQYPLWKNQTKKDYLPVLCKNYKLSDDIAFRFGNRGWSEYPLKTEKFIHWLGQTCGETINLFMDFETFGEHQWADTGIFEFMESLPAQTLEQNIGFSTPSETIQSYEAREEFSSPHYTSWADEARDLSAWLENDLQKSVMEELRLIESQIHHWHDATHLEKMQILEDFRKLQTSDHLYYMCTKYWCDGDVHAYFSPYESPYDAYINYMNVLEHLKKRIRRQLSIPEIPPFQKETHVVAV